MSKIAEKIHDTALKKGEEYSKSHGGSIIEEVAYGRGYKTAYIEGYDQAMKDVMKHAEELQFRSDDWGYAYGCGYEKAMQDFLEKACKYIKEEFPDMYIRYIRGYSIDDEIEQFENYIKNE